MPPSIAPQSLLSGYTISFCDVVVKVSSGVSGQSRTVVDNACGVIPSSSLCGILGPSAAGKTSLLNALAQRSNSKVSGSILINGRSADRRFYTRQTALITQQSVLLPAMTPREAIVFSSAMRLHHRIGHAAHVANAAAIIEALSLQRCADSRIGDDLIGGLSGGEKRRVAVGVELVTHPSILFADEPMSGLDSQTALTLTRSLKRITRASPPVTVVATVHQPSHDIFALFDHIILMAQGRILYCGSAADAVSYMNGLGLICPAQTNPPEHLLDLIQGATDEDDHRRDMMQHQYQIEYTKQSKEHSVTQLITDISPSVDDNFLTTSLSSANNTFPPYRHELYYLLHRAHINVTRQPLLRAAQVLQSIILGFLVGLGFLNISHTAIGIQNRLGCIYFILLSIIFANCFAVVLTFAEERAIFLKEQKSYLYRILSYFISKTIIDILPNLICSILFSIISYYLISFQLSFIHFLIYILVIIIIGFIGSSMGLIVASYVHNRIYAMMLTPLVIAPFIIFTPYAFPYKNCPIYFIWLLYLSPFWWSFTILAINEFNELSLTCLPSERIIVPPLFGYNLGSVCFFTQGNQVLTHFNISIENNNIQWCFLALIIQAIGYRLLAFLLLTLSARRAVVKQ